MINLTRSFILILFFCLIGKSSFAQQLPSTESAISICEDGTAPFDASAGPGLDDGITNGIVRNFDVVVYNVEFTVNDASDSNNVLTINLNDKASWTGLPLSCLSTANDGVVPDSVILDTTGDLRSDTLICNLGPLKEGTKLLIKPTATAVGANGDIIEASVCSDSDGNVNTGLNVTAQCSGPVETEITAAFRVNVSKSVAGLPIEDEIEFEPPAFNASSSPYGVQGQMMIWRVNINYAAGSELLANVGGLADIGLIDDATVTHLVLGDISASDTMEPFVMPGVTACSPVGAVSYTIACTQPGGPGAPIEISLTGVPVTNQQIASFNLFVWVPESDIDQDPAVAETIDILNQVTVTELNGNPAPLTSVTGTVNPGAETASADFLVGEAPNAPGFTQRKGFDGIVVGKSYARAAAKGEIFEVSIAINRGSLTREENLGVCDTIDTSLFEFAGVDPVGVQLDSNLHGRPAPQIDADVPYHGLYNPVVRYASVLSSLPAEQRIQYGDAALQGVVVEFSDSPNLPNSNEANCDNTHNWVADYTTLPGGAASVTKVRMLWPHTVANTISLSAFGALTKSLQVYFSFNLKIKEDPAISTGDFLCNTTTRTNDFIADVWIDPVSDTSSLYSFSGNVADPSDPFYCTSRINLDRVQVVDSSMAVSKVTSPISLTEVKPLDPVDFTIDARTSGANASAVTMTITDTLPPELVYVGDDCAVQIPGCTGSVAGNVITWTIPGYQVGDPLAPFTLNTIVASNAAVGSFTNEVEISSDFADLATNSSPDSLEADTSLVVVNDSGFSVRKLVNGAADLSFAPAGTPFSFNLGYRNLGGSDLGVGQIIDVLPNLNDAAASTFRTPLASLFNGTLALSSITVSNGEAEEYTTDAPATIQHQPCHPDNWPAGDDISSNALMAQICANGLLDANGATSPANVGTGATVWLPGPAPLDDTVTALRFTTTAIPAGDPERFIDVALLPMAFIDGDIYCDNFGAQVESCTLDVISNDVCIQVVAGEIGDYLWLDLNQDGIQDPSELPLAGVTVKLLDALGDPILQDPITGAIVPAGTPGAVPYVAVTDASGNYQFENLPPGDYSVMVDTSTLPPGLTQTFDADGAGDNMSAVTLDVVLDPASGLLVDVESNQDQDFGYYVELASLGDTIFLDDNMDGIQDAGEAPVEGVEVTLICFGPDGVLGGTDDQVFSTLTDTNGMYFFPNLFPGLNYQVTVTPPAGFDLSPQGVGGDPALDSSVDPLTGSTPVIVLGVGENNLTFDAGIFRPNGLATVLWNGFCDQQNFIMLNNTCSEPVVITLELFGMEGESLGNEIINLSPLQQIDFSINSLPGFSMFNMGIANLLSIPGGCVQGDMGLFAPIGAGQFFSASIQDNTFGGTGNLFSLSNGLESNACYAGFNTFQPSINSEDQGLPTTHWLQLANLSSEKQNFTINRYEQSGELVASDRVSVNGFGRQDLAAGHEDEAGERYGIVEVVPEIPGTDYTAQLFRYGVDQTTLSGERMSAFSLSDNCSIGASGVQYAGVSKGAGAANWLELLNISNSTQTVTVEVLSNTGGVVSGQSFELNPLQTIHFDAAEGLLEGESGVARITSESPLIAKSTSYIYRPDGRILTSETLEGRGLLGARAAGSFNGFRNQLNWLRLYNVTGAEVEVVVSGTSQEGEALGERTVRLSGESGQDIDLNGLFNIGATDVGTVQLDISVGGAVLAEIVRVQHSDSGVLEDIETFAVQ